MTNAEARQEATAIKHYSKIFKNQSRVQKFQKEMTEDHKDELVKRDQMYEQRRQAIQSVKNEQKRKILEIDEALKKRLEDNADVKAKL